MAKISVLSSDCGDALDLNQEMGDLLTALAYLSVSAEGNISCVIDCVKYFSLKKLLRVTCFVKKFVQNLEARVGRGKCLEEDSTVAEMNEANVIGVKRNILKNKN